MIDLAENTGKNRLLHNLGATGFLIPVYAKNL